VRIECEYKAATSETSGTIRPLATFSSAGAQPDCPIDVLELHAVIEALDDE
jgi:hypothetical protein